MSDAFMVSLTFATADESTEEVEEAIREFVSSRQWQIVSLTVFPAD